eukprot:3399036-Pyramimonas_sp.AAC.1
MIWEFHVLQDDGTVWAQDARRRPSYSSKGPEDGSKRPSRRARRSQHHTHFPKDFERLPRFRSFGPPTARGASKMAP